MCAYIRNVNLVDRLLDRLVDAGGCEQKLPAMHIAANRARFLPRTDSGTRRDESTTDAIDLPSSLNVCEPQRMLWKVSACECPDLVEVDSPVMTDVLWTGDAMESFTSPALLACSGDSITFFRDYRKFYDLLMRIVLDGR